LRSVRNKLLISLALGGFIFLLLSFYGNFGKILDTFKVFKWYYLPYLLILSLLNYIFRFFKWDYYLSILGIKIRKSESLSIFMSGLIMSVTPAKIGEFLKSYLLKELNGTPISYSAPVVVAERFTDFIAMVILSSYGVFSFKYGYRALLINTIIVIIFLFIFSNRNISLKLISFFDKFPLFSRLTPKIITAYESIYRIMTLKPLVFATIVSVFAWFFECYTFFLVLKAFGHPIPLLQSVFIYAFSTLLGALSMLPGGLGAMEGSMTGFLIIMINMPRHLAVASTLITRIATLWFAVLVGIVALILSRNIYKGAYPLDPNI
jgi:uncharacterized protein (TIRG00374 family)